MLLLSRARLLLTSGELSLTESSQPVLENGSTGNQTNPLDFTSSTDKMATKLVSSWSPLIRSLFSITSTPLKKDGNIYLDICCYHNDSIISQFYLQNLRSPVQPGQKKFVMPEVRRYELTLGELEGVGAEIPLNKGGDGRDYQYEVAHTWDSPVLYPAFLARNRMVTCGFTKTTKVRNNFIIFSKTIVRAVLKLIKNSWHHTVKVEGEKLKLRTEICLWGLPLSWVLLQTWSTHRLILQHLAPVLMPNTAKGSAFCFFSVHSHSFCDGPYTWLGKTPVFIASVTCNSRNRVTFNGHKVCFGCTDNKTKVCSGISSSGELGLGPWHWGF